MPVNENMGNVDCSSYEGSKRLVHTAGVLLTGRVRDMQVHTKITLVTTSVRMSVLAEQQKVPFCRDISCIAF